MKFFSAGHVPSTVSARSDLQTVRIPDTRGKWESFKKYIYDKQYKTVCNRTAKSWALLWLFYILFLIIAIGLFASFTAAGILYINGFNLNKPVVSLHDLRGETTPPCTTPKSITDVTKK